MYNILLGLEFSITFHKDNIIVNNEIVMMNKTNLAVIAVLAAAALLVGTVVTTAAFASSFSLKQSIKQKQEQAGIINLGEQNAQNNLCVLTGANCGRQ